MGRKTNGKKGKWNGNRRENYKQNVSQSRESTLDIVWFECGNTIQLFGLPVDSELRLIRNVISIINECDWTEGRREATTSCERML